MTEGSNQHGCANCARLQAELDDLKARFTALENQLAKARKNSSNSSKPPSSDIVNPPTKSGRRRRNQKLKRGGQPGHPRHERSPFSPEPVDVTWIHYYTGCPCCGGELVNTNAPPQARQQVDCHCDLRTTRPLGF